MATIKDVAKKAGVTIGTVSRVLNNKKWVSEDCRKKVLAAIRDLHYKPQAHARRLRQKHSQICGVIAPHHTTIFHSPFFTKIMEGFEEVAAEKQYRLLIVPISWMLKLLSMISASSSVNPLSSTAAWTACSC